MAKSKSRKSKNTRPGNRTAPQDLPSVMVARSQALYLPLPYPAWQIPEVVATIQQVEPSLATEVLLEMLLSHPLQILGDDGQVTSILPLDLVGDENSSASEVLATLEIFNEVGALTWDGDTRTYRLINSVGA